MSEKFDLIIKRVVEGQVRDFLNAHPEVLDTGTTTWKTPPGKTRERQLMDSIAKRVTRDLTCPANKARLVEALEASAEAEAGDLYLAVGSGE